MKIIDTDTLLTSKFLNVKATEYEDKEKNSKYWYWVQRPNGLKAVVIVAVIDKGGFINENNCYEKDYRLVVIKEFRFPIENYEWGFPAGLVNEGEDAIEAAKRELTEETGLIAKRVIRATPFIYNSAGITDESISMVYIECEGEISKDNLESSEDIETFLMTRKEVEQLISDRTKKFGAKAYIVMENFVRYNEI